MITLKQIEALHWIVKLGSFERAAAKLNTTQSAISKRVQELEASTGEVLFDRNQRSARLTEEGEHLLALGREILALYERMLDRKNSGEGPARRLRIGVTELSAMTWLPRLVTALRQSFPTLTIDPEVHLSRNLHDRLLEDSIDIIVIPEVWSDPDITAVRLAEVSNDWMARPGLVTSSRCWAMQDLAQHPVFLQGAQSGTGIFYGKWLRSHGVELQRALTSDGLMALVGLTVAGLGVSYLPRQCFQPLIDEGKLEVVSTDPGLPPPRALCCYVPRRSARPIYLDG